ncbi:MAG: hypothetical protein ACNA8W_26590, partial [Bradymonadaceae bacterium]
SVACPRCQGEVSLLKRPWLSRKKDRPCYIERIADPATKTFTKHLRTEGLPHDEDSSGWMGTALICPFCEHQIDERKAQEALLIEKGFDEITAYCTSLGRGRGKQFHEAEANLIPDDELLWGAIASDLEAMGQEMPDSGLPTWSGITNPTLYGIHRFHEMFGLRQLAMLVRTCRLFRDLYPGWVEAHGEERAKAVAAFLSGFIDQLTDWNSRLCTWISQNEQVGRSLAGPGLPMVWDFVEIDPLVQGPANLRDKLKRIVQGMKAVPVFEQGLRLAPDNRLLMNNLALAYALHGDARRALNLFESSLGRAAAY